MSTFLILSLQIAILAYAFVGGVFLAFSDFIMRSLKRTGDRNGIDTMQVINREVFHWIVMSLFLGMAAVSLALVLYGAVGLSGAAGSLILLAGLTYLIGCFGVTALCNVPMNERLSGLDGSDEAARAYWAQTYLPRWTFWNSVRTGACAVAAGLLQLGLVALIRVQI